MFRTRLVQLIAAAVTALAIAASGALLPGVLRSSEDNVLRYTNVSVQNAPPIVALGTAIGALRGLIVDILWIKVNAMKESGLYYEVMALSDLITKLQPRFASVWAFHGHNMAYNISVATNTPEERWTWVQAGIRLVRNEGLRYNPNDLALHRELAFWFAHKIEGVADDAHFTYKREICKEWHYLLGEPPESWDDRIAWIKKVADAPETLEEAERRTPGVTAVIDRFKASYPTDVPGISFRLDYSFLASYVKWDAITRRSSFAKTLDLAAKQRAKDESFARFDDVASDPAAQPAIETLVAYVRKKVLRENYNMDPQLMYEYTRDLGPIDWRHGQAHALYWSRKGSQTGAGRVNEHDIYISLNNDSQQIQAMQDLSRFGRISYDPLSATEIDPARAPDTRWVDAILKTWPEMYKKYYDVPGGGCERFLTFIRNFMPGAIREWYRRGEIDKALQAKQYMAEQFSQGLLKDPTWINMSLDAIVYEETYDQYQARPDLAPNDVVASLTGGFNIGLGSRPARPEILQNALQFAKQVTTWFKGNSWNNYTTKMGTQRMADLIPMMDSSVEIAYLQVLTSPATHMEDRMQIWAATDQVERQIMSDRPDLLDHNVPLWRAMVYDRVMPILAQQFQHHELSTKMTVDEAFPPPPNLDQARRMLQERAARWKTEEEDRQKRDSMERKG